MSFSSSKGHFVGQICEKMGLANTGTSVIPLFDMILTRGYVYGIVLMIIGLFQMQYLI